MNTILFNTLHLLFWMQVLVATAQPPNFRTVDNIAFQRGEKLNYHVYYHSMLTGNILAGKASLEIKPENPKMLGRDIMHVVGLGTSAGSFDWFFKVRDRYETYIDEKAIVPWYLMRRVDEGGYKITQDMVFNHYKNTVKCNDKTYRIPAYTQDILSFFYAARSMNTSTLKKGDSFPLSFFLDDSVYTIKIMYEGRETIKTKAGTFKCLRFKPTVLTGNVFKDPYPMTLWVTDDKNHIPVLLKSAVIVGSVKLELVNFSGLLHPSIAKID